MSERVAILATIETIGSGGYQDPKRQNFAVSKDTAAKRAGLGNKETARQAKKVVESGAPGLVEAMDAGARIRDQLKDTPGVSDRQIAKRLGVHHSTVGSARNELEQNGEVANLAT